MRARVHRSRVTHDRWLVSYADFITLLFAFFVVLYAFARADQKKQAEVPLAIDSAFKSLGVFPDYSFKKHNSGSGSGSGSGSEKGASPAADLVMTEQALTPSVVGDDLNRIRHDLEQRLQPQVAQHTIVINMGRDGLVISLREAGFFNSGSALPRPDAIPALRRIAASLQGSPYDLRVEGHTDNIPIHTAQFASNWELSSARASSIARILLAIGAMPAQRLAAAGYAEFHPVDTNDTPQGRANNRRVDLIVLPRTAVNFAAPRSSANGPWRRIVDSD
jgi:chemotaxis protein MotB